MSERLLDMLDQAIRDDLQSCQFFNGAIEITPVAQVFTRWLEGLYPETGGLPPVIPPSQFVSVMAVYSLTDRSAFDAMEIVQGHIRSKRYRLTKAVCQNITDIACWEAYFSAAEDVANHFTRGRSHSERWKNKAKFWRSLVVAIEQLEGITISFRLPQPAIRIPVRNQREAQYAATH